MKKLILYLVVFLSLPALAQAASLAAGSCSAADIATAITACTGACDTVTFAGPCTWTTTVNINKAITVQGSGTITWSGSSTAITMNASTSTVKGFTILSDGGSGTMISIGDSINSWRVTGMTLDGGGGFTGKFIRSESIVSTSETYGLIDNNIIQNMKGEQGGIFYGPCDSWQTDHSMGGAANLFIENNTITAKAGETAYWNFGPDVRVVSRYNTMTNVYFDGHGKYSNTNAACAPITHRSVRHMEYYNNYNTFSGSIFSGFYPRGGTGRIFNNKFSSTSHGGAMIMLDEYCVRVNDTSAGNQCTLKPCSAFDGTDAPLVDQIGRGKDTSTPPSAGTDQASEPMYIWNNRYANDNSIILVSPLNDSGYGNNCTAINGTVLSDFVRSGTDYFVSTDKPEAMSAYTPYTCPHPLAGAGTCDAGTAGVTGYALTGGGIASNQSFGSTTASGAGRKMGSTSAAGSGFTIQ